MRALIILAGCLVAGCSPTTAPINTMQFSEETLPFPENYQVEAARIVAQRRADTNGASVSYPQTTLGLSPFSPRRWYVCVRGVSDEPKPERIPRPGDIIEGWIDPRAEAGIHNVVLFFGTTGRPTAKDGYDSPLCRNSQYEPITATAPVT